MVVDTLFPKERMSGSLELGKSIKVGSLSFEGLEIATPKEVIVCSVRATRASRSAAAAEDAQ